MNTETKQDPWHQKTTPIVLLIIFFFPVGLFLLWKHPTWTTKTKQISTGVFCAFLVIGLIGQEPEENIDNGNTADIPSISNSETDQQEFGQSPELDSDQEILPEEEISKNLLMLATLKETPVMNGVNTERIGTSAHIEMEKDTMRNQVTGNDLYEFSKKIVEQGEYNWVSINFEDGTGLFFHGNTSFVANYCEIKEDGTASTTIYVYARTEDSFQSLDSIEVDSEVTNTEMEENNDSVQDTDSEVTPEPEPTVEVTPVPPVESTQETPQETSSELMTPTNTRAYVGSTDSDKFHYESCRWAEKILAVNLLTFDSIDNAKARGYVACGTCNPR